MNWISTGDHRINIHNQRDGHDPNGQEGADVERLENFHFLFDWPVVWLNCTVIVSKFSEVSF